MILNFIAVFLFCTLALSGVNFIFVLVSYGWKKTLKGYWRSSAISVDRFGNYHFRAMWNKLLIKPEGYKFGNLKETMSSCLGKNKEKETLSILGKIICWIVDLIDVKSRKGGKKGHCLESINNNVND